ncbi:hypothetical protein VCRA2119O147_2460005 [Vibrio crassostreae]|nr:hypothetical protein VCRA2119O45_590005 [Vibrio crassostreae]CAK2319873.1 hypothetical protein VCRA2119O147_2460005 [Vibrio crassostreae]
MMTVQQLIDWSNANKGHRLASFIKAVKQATKAVEFNSEANEVFDVFEGHTHSLAFHPENPMWEMQKSQIELNSIQFNSR